MCLFVQTMCAINRDLRGLDTRSRFSPFYKGDKLRNFMFAFLLIKTLLKGVHSKRKEFAPRGSKFFPFRVDPFSEGSKTILTVESLTLESVSIPLNVCSLRGLDILGSLYTSVYNADNFFWLITNSSLFKYTKNFTTKK